MTDFEQHKITIFSGINDVSIAPTATAGSNISHIHQQFNNLIDSIITGNQQLEATINNNYNTLNSAFLNNQGLINTNSTTISNNKTYHDNVTNDIQTDLTGVTGRVDSLETTVQGFDQGTIDTLTDRINQLENTIAEIQNTLAGDTSEFIFNNVSFTNDGLYENYVITIPKTGTLTKIEFNDVNQLSEIYIEYSGVDLITSENLGEDENYPYVLDFNPTISVNDQDTLKIYTEYQELTLTSIKLTIT